jgi:ribonucleoside-diphosphate reductase alpha chain
LRISDPKTSEKNYFFRRKGISNLGPKLELSESIHQAKYRLKGETFHDSTARIADALADNSEHFVRFKEILRQMRFLPAGRVQAAMGAPRRVTPYNCFVSGRVEDSMSSIMGRASEAAETMRLGGGIGYDFSELRPRGDRIVSLDSHSSGPVSFMGIYDAICQTIAASGHRRGAQMGVLRVDHPDIEEFVHAKQNSDRLTAFNISVGISDEFMQAVRSGNEFVLRFGGNPYKTVDARRLWDEIMRSTWSYAEPGVLFLDTINKWNNLWYCESINATNPCAEQPLPPNGACLLGSFNLTSYVDKSKKEFDIGLFVRDIPHVIRAMDNIVEKAVYPLPAQEKEAISKRRMGIGVTGLANTLEFLGFPYGSSEFIEAEEGILSLLANHAYKASADLAKEKGPFPLYVRDKYVQAGFIRTLDPSIQDRIYRYGVRNSHLLSIAPTGTISLTANNISSGIEPVFLERFERTVQTPEGPKATVIEDFGSSFWGVTPKTADKCTVEEHLGVLLAAQKHVDSSVSKTCNVGDDVSWEKFKNIYQVAYHQGAKGCTTFRAAGQREGILKEVKDTESGETTIACAYDPETGMKSCDE